MTVSSERILSIRCPDWPLPVAGSGEPDPMRRFEPVVRALTDLTWQVDVMAPGWACLAARGPARRLGGDAALAAHCAELLSDLVAEPVGVGVADGRHTADLAACRAVGAAPLVVPSAQTAEFLAPMSLRWLAELTEIPADLIGVWAHLGLRTYGDLAAMDALDLQDRFGPLGLRAHALVCGVDPRPVGVDPAPMAREYLIAVDEPIPHLEAVVFVAAPLADRIEADLAATGRVSTRVSITLGTDHGEHSRRCWYLGSGLRRAQILERVRWQLEGWAAGAEGGQAMTAGVVTVRVDVLEAVADAGTQGRFWGGRSRADEAALRCISRLAAMAGSAAVRRPVWRGGRLPDERYRWVPAMDVPPTSPAAPAAPAVQEAWPGALPAPSPLWLHDPPIAIGVRDERGCEVTVSGRGEISAPPAWVVLAEGEHAVVGWAGPWPVEERWWEPRAARRLARFQMLCADGSAVLAAVEQGRWWMLAQYA